MKFKFHENPLFYVLLFVLLVIIITIAGLFLYNFTLRQEKNKTYSSLSTLARLKVHQITKWREDRISEAEFIQSNLQFKRLVSGYLKYPQFKLIKNEIAEWLRPIKENHEYVNISIIDTSGNIYSLYKESDSLNNQDRILYSLSMKNNEIILSGFYRKGQTSEIRMGSFIPLSLQEINKGKVFAVLELRINPRINLYPLIELSPLTSLTAESYIVKEEGDSVVYLSDLKFKENSAVSYKLPLSRKDLPSAMAVKGITGIYEGRDYNNVEVLTDLRSIPNSPWYIVSRIDLEEVYAPVRRQAFYILIGMTTLILLSGSIVFIAWKNEKIEAVKKQLRYEREKKDLFKNMSEGYAYCRMIFSNGKPEDFEFIEVNDAFMQLTGLKEITGKRASEYNPNAKEKHSELFNILGKVASTGIPEKFETYRDATRKWISVSAYSPQKEYFVAIINDITQHKKYVIELKKLSSAVEQSPASVIITDLDGNIEYVNPKFTEISGFSFEEAIGNKPSILKSGKTPKHVYSKLWKTLTTGNEWQGEILNKKKNGELYWEYASICPIKNETGTITHYIAVKEDITKRKQIEKELEESEERFRRMFEDHKAVMLFIEPSTGSIVDANPAAVQFYGFKKHQLCSMKIQDITTAPLENLHAENDAETAGGHYIFPHKLSNGEIRIVEVYSSQLEIKRKPLLFQIIHDITERRQTEIKLELSEQKYRELVEVQQELIVRVDMEGRYNFVNEAYCRKFGFKREDLIGKKSFRPLVYPDDLPDTLEKMKLLESPPYRVKIEQRAYTTEGLRWIEWDDTAIMDHSGKIVEVQGVGRDINERKQAEDALRQSEERFRNLADSMPQIVWTANPDGSVDYYNNRVSELEGISRNPDGSWKWFPVLHEDDVNPTVEAWNKSFNSGSYYEITHRVKTKYGKYKWLLSRAYPIKNSEGKIVKWYGTATDINEQKETEKALELALLELKRSNKELEQFAYTASHDLQEPIRMIRSYAQLLELKNKESLNKGGREYLKYITEGASRMQLLINDLLMYSRVTTTKKNFEEVDCSLILKDVLEDLKFRIQEENAAIEAAVLPVVKGDRTQLRQLFQNLIQNAVKFRCEKNPEIKIACKRDNGSWLFSVSDNGIGIDPKFHERIFTIFQRLNPREKYPGTGVGLAICKKIVENHGGRIYVESDLNKGAAFFFSIPV